MKPHLQKFQFGEIEPFHTCRGIFEMSYIWFSVVDFKRKNTLLLKSVVYLTSYLWNGEVNISGADFITAFAAWQRELCDALYTFAFQKLGLAHFKENLSFIFRQKVLLLYSLYPFFFYSHPRRFYFLLQISEISHL